MDRGRNVKVLWNQVNNCDECIYSKAMAIQYPCRECKRCIGDKKKEDMFLNKNGDK